MNLLPASCKFASVLSVAKHCSGHDSGGIRTGEQINTAVTGATVNNLNQAIALSSTGPVHFSGTLNEAANVTVNGLPATVDGSHNFSANVPLSPGLDTVAVAATNGNGQTATKNYAVTVTDSGVSRTLTYDLDGGMTNNGAGQIYTFDAANRLSTVTQGGNVTAFVYNGAGQRVQEKLNGVVIKQWIWCGGVQPCEERDGANAVTKRFYALGEQVISAGTTVNYYFTKDHLGSVREMTDSSGTIHARYDYDPYGRKTKLAGDLDADFGFTGDYYHVTSGLNLTLYRAYDVNLGRWLSRNPLPDAERAQGPNLYCYVANNPISRIDRNGTYFGLDDAFLFLAGTAAGLVSQGISDIAHGKFSGVGAYGASGLAGGVGAAASEYITPVGGAALGGFIKSALTQEINSGKLDYSIGDATKEAVISGATALIPLPKIPGLTSGTNSFAAVEAATVTKLENQTIENVAAKTLAKAAAKETYEAAGHAPLEAGFQALFGLGSGNCP